MTLHEELLARFDWVDGHADIWRLFSDGLQRAALDPGDVVVLVDDWAERGAQALAARRLIEDCGVTFAGLAIIVDQLEDAVRERIGRVHALVRAEELGPSG